MTAKQIHVAVVSSMGGFLSAIAGYGCDGTGQKPISGPVLAATILHVAMGNG